MIAHTLGLLMTFTVVLSHPHPGPSPHPAPSPYPGPSPHPAPGAYPAPYPYAGPAPAPNYGYGFGGGFGGCGCGCPYVEEIITPPVIPPVLNTVDVYDIATLGVIPAPPIEYVYPAVGYEAFGLGCNGGYGNYGYY